VALSFFYRNGPLSSEIRGRQIGSFLGAKLNPTEGFEDDVCILVKELPKNLLTNRGLALNRAKTYIDILDYSGGVQWLTGRPDVKVIVASASARQFLEDRFPNPLTLIPQHHCNVKRQLRPQRPIRTVAYVGLMATAPWWFGHVNAAVAKMGLEMRYFTTFKTRQDVVDAYLQTDIQFTWYDKTMPDRWRQMKNALKVVNAASFGIPTVASCEPAYVAECLGRFVFCDSLELAMDSVSALKGPALYDAFTDGLPAFAEPYHIENIAKRYRELDDRG
jgi:hypothetical protein